MTNNYSLKKDGVQFIAHGKARRAKKMAYLSQEIKNGGELDNNKMEETSTPGKNVLNEYSPRVFGNTKPDAWVNMS